MFGKTDKAALDCLGERITETARAKLVAIRNHHLECILQLEAEIMHRQRALSEHETIYRTLKTATETINECSDGVKLKRIVPLVSDDGDAVDRLFLEALEAEMGRKR